MNTQKADLILVNGRFLTMEKEGEVAQAVAISSGRILYVGSRKEAERYATAETTVLDLQGRVASPGLIDCHTHPIGYVSRFLGCDLREDTFSSEKLFARLRKAAQDTPEGQWIVARGYDESKFSEGPTEMNREVLDKISSRHPIYLARTCGHIAVLNSPALEICGFTETTKDPESGGHLFKDEKGKLTGMISGSVLNKVPYPKLTAEEKERGMIFGVQEEYFRKGITSTAELGGSSVGFRMLQKLEREGKLKLRIGLYFSGRRYSPQFPMAERLSGIGLLPGFGSERTRFLGIKFVMDGSTGGRTAAFSLPYADDPENYGELYNDPEILLEDVLKSARAGLQISIHAIGDRAIEEALKTIEKVNEMGVDTKKLRIRLEHLESPTPEQIERIKKLGILVGLSSAFIYSLGDSHLTALGYDRTVDAFPAKTLMDNGILIACNSDCSVCDVNPMYGIYSMVTRKTQKGQSFGGKKEAVDRICALEAYTKNSAYLLWHEDEIGTLKAGKLADLVVFDEDILNVPEENLKDVSVYMTLSQGEVVYEKNK